MNKVNDNKILSIILPCYNVDKYITDCLNSLYNQDLDEDLYEVICVNDCSSDNTRSKILEFQESHQNLLLIDHTVNKRVGAARNTGFLSSKGKFIWHVDPDDTISQNVLGTILNKLETEKLDFLQFCHLWMDENKKQINKPPYDHNFYQKTNMITGIDFIRLYKSLNIPFSNMHVGCFVRVFSREFLDQHQIMFPEVSYYEDQYFTIKCLLHAKRLMNINESFYNYRVVNTSYTHKPMDICKRAGQLIVCCDIYETIENPKLPSELFEYIWKRYIPDYQYCLSNFLLSLTNKERTLFIRLIKSKINTLKRILRPREPLMCRHPHFYLATSLLLSKPYRIIKKLKASI